MCTMLYPKILNIKRSNFVIKLLILISVIIAISSFIVNYITTPTFKWSLIVCIGIIYTWITTLYAIKKNINISSNVLLQFVCVSVITVLLDYIIGYKGWAISLALPIIIVVSNMTMLVLTIVSHKKYFKYALNHLIILIISMIAIIFVILKVDNKSIIFIVIVYAFILATLLTTIFLCRKDLKEKLKRVFHL